MIKPIVRSVVTSFEGQVGYAIVDIDKLPQLADQHSVHAIPAIFTVKGDEVLSKFEGAAQNPDELKSYVRKALKGETI